MMDSSAIEDGIQHEKPGVERILRAAMRCLARGDAEKVSMREIAAEAGVAKSLLHYHFRSKDELMLELLDRFLASMIRRIDATGWPLSRPGAGPEAVAQSLELIWTELRRAGDIQAICLRVAARGTLEKAVRERLVGVQRRLRRILADSVRLGLGADHPLDAEAVADLLLATLIGFEASRLFADDVESVERAFELFKNLAALAAGLPT